MTTTTDRTRVDVPPPWKLLGSPLTRAVLRIQHTVLSATRDYLVSQGFTEILPPVIGPVTDPGTRGSKQVEIDYYGSTYRLMASAILYKQATLLATDKIFCVAPNVRLEPLEAASTGRHLVEFHQIDVEMAHAGRDEAMAVAEGVVRAAVGAVLADRGAELHELDRDLTGLRVARDEPFAHLTHAEATERLRSGDHLQDPYAELDWEGEAKLSRWVGRPMFVTDYPKGSRGFYDREDDRKPGRLRNFDLLASEGFGELASGGEREFEHRRVITRMRETGENPSKYEWYLDLVRRGIPASAGFGVGVERLVRYLAGVPHIWQATAFPKLPGMVSP